MAEGRVAIRSFSNSLDALTSLEAVHADLLITGMEFAVGQPNGVSLAQMVRTIQPQIAVLFTGNANHEDQAHGLGMFIAMPAPSSEVVAKAIQILREKYPFTSLLSRLWVA